MINIFVCILVINNSAYEHIYIPYLSSCKLVSSTTETYLRGLDPDADEQLGVGKWQLDHLPQLPDLIPQPPDLREADAPGVFVKHVEHGWVYLSWQLPHDRERGHVEGYPRARLEGGLVQLVAAPHHVSGPARRLHDEAVVVQLLQYVPDYLTHALFVCSMSRDRTREPAGEQHATKRSDRHWI